MNRKIKLALAALLGFSTACSSVKNAPKTGEEKQTQETDSLQVKMPPRVVLMYGVRPPSEKVRQRLEQQLPDSLPPVAERPEDDTPPLPKK